MANDRSCVPCLPLPPMSDSLPSDVASLPSLPKSGHVFENDFFKVVQTETRGWTAVAKKDIEHGQIILAEEAIMYGDHHSLYRNFYALSTDKQEVVLSLAAYHPRPESKKMPLGDIFRTNW